MPRPPSSEQAQIAPAVPAPSRKVRQSLSGSWDDANYFSSSDEASIRSGPSLESVESELEEEEEEEDDDPTPMPKRRVGYFPQQLPQEPTPLKPSKGQNGHAKSRTPSSAHIPGPSFIMPSPVGTPSTRATRRSTSASTSALKSPAVRPRNLPQRLSGSAKREASTETSSEPSSASERTQGGMGFGSIWNYLLRPLTGYLFSVFKLLASPLQYLIAGLLLLLILQSTYTLILRSFKETIQPICYVPGMDYIIPWCARVSYMGKGEPEPHFEDLISVQSKFEDMLEASTSGYTFPAQMRLGESSIRDLSTLVKYSRIPSRAELEHVMRTFIEQSRDVANELTRFNSGVNKAVDKVLSTNRWTLQVLNGLSEQENLRGLLTRQIDKINPFYIFLGTPRSLQSRVFDQYLTHISVVEDEISGLITHAEAILRGLRLLDEQLDDIGGIAARDMSVIVGNTDEILASVWTALGGNRHTLAKSNRQIEILKQVGRQRMLAMRHVSETLVKLQEVAVGLEDLRERVGEPQVVGTKAGMPLKFYIDVIERGAERLQESRGLSRSRDGEVWDRLKGNEKDRGIESGTKTITITAS